MNRRPIRHLCLALLLLTGCGDDDASSSDASTTDAGEATGPATPPDIPWLADGQPPVALTPCPTGWRSVEEPSGLTVCEPWPESGYDEACGAGEAHFPGTPGCAPIGNPCPATGPYSDALPTDRPVIHVQPGATGGDGTRASPYGSTSEFSLTRLSSGSVVALSAGRHAGPVRLPRGVTLWGACTAMTELFATTFVMGEGVVTTFGADSGLTDLRISRSERVGLVAIGDGNSIHLSGVEIAEARDIGLFVFRGATLTADGLAVRATRARPMDGFFGQGLSVNAAADIRRVVVEGNRDAAVFAGEAGTVLTLADAVVRATEAQQAQGTGGRGLNADFGGTLEARTSVVELNRELGVFASAVGSRLVLEDSVVRDTLPTLRDDTGGRAISIQLGAVAEVRRTRVERSLDVAVYAAGSGTELTFEDGVVRDTTSQVSDGLDGRAFNFQMGADGTIARTVVERNREVGIFAAVTNTHLRVEDVVVRDTIEEERSQDGGRGISVQHAVVVLNRTLFERNRDIGVFIDGSGANLDAADVVVLDMSSRAIDDDGGRAVSIQNEAIADLERGLFERSREIAIFAYGAGATAQLRDIIVRDARQRGCATGACAESPGGHGIASYVNADLAVDRFVVERAELCGLHVARDGQLSATAGEVASSLFGACIQVADFDVETLTAAVTFRDNEVNLDSTDLPVPEPGGVLDLAP